MIYIYYDTEVFSKHHACVILWKCFKLCLYKARGVDSLGPPHPGRPSPRSAAHGPLAARPHLPRRRSGAQGIGRAVPSPAPCPRPPAAAQHTTGPGSGGPPPPGSRARPPWGNTLSVYPARPSLRAVLPHTPLPRAHAAHNHRKPHPLTTHYALSLTSLTRCYVPLTASQVELPARGY